MVGDRVFDVVKRHKREYLLRHFLLIEDNRLIESIIEVDYTLD